MGRFKRQSDRGLIDDYPHTHIVDGVPLLIQMYMWRVAKKDTFPQETRESLVMRLTLRSPSDPKDETFVPLKTVNAVPSRKPLEIS
jgi:hypothetical protein